MNAFMREFTTAAQQAPKLYFEPLVTVIRFMQAVRDAWEMRQRSAPRSGPLEEPGDHGSDLLP